MRKGEPVPSQTSLLKNAALPQRKYIATQKLLVIIMKAMQNNMIIFTLNS